ncbi:MAG: aminotransferase class I/II-fold pyridoxal phosphate-dependent enzyme [Cyanobacteria bacterium NC_groundwater_1444_Ag_S-0.65um_54_12]|nr:aminotransferase class I/II-fold pyridoxal phosphate-dependent enzyme [Cyanobacteria bacterium NC_groundwater_1444_Ag_S-0.65um_54_12]
MTVAQKTFAERLALLGTETAFAVSAEAAAHAAKGYKVYPFHLGDLNLPTPANIIEATIKAMRDGKTGYCPNYGIPQLREVLATDINRTHGTNYTMANVAIQPGGKPVINKFFLALLNPGDEVLYPNPGYPIYESQIEFLGGKAVPYGYCEGDKNFEMLLDDLEGAITARTRFLVFNNLQNPTGAVSSRAELQRVAELACKYDLWVLCDEAYFDISYEDAAESLVSFPGMAERCVILYTFSKKFAMTGWRLGAAIGPKAVIDVIAKLSVNDESCSNHFIQYGAIEALTGDQIGPRQIIQILQERRDHAVAILDGMAGVHCFKPNATFYLFPNVTQAMKCKGITSYDEFRLQALEQTGVSFCTRLHFGRARPGETERYIRLAYSGIDVAQIAEGLAKFQQFIEN